MARRHCIWALPNPRCRKMTTTGGILRLGSLDALGAKVSRVLRCAKVLRGPTNHGMRACCHGSPWGGNAHWGLASLGVWQAS